jgi:hypothetical protein
LNGIEVLVPFSKSKEGKFEVNLGSGSYLIRSIPVEGDK